MRLMIWAFLAVACLGRELEIRRPAWSWQYTDAVGRRAALLGQESGVFEAWVHPLKIVEQVQLDLGTPGRSSTGPAVSRSIVARPGSFTIVYAGDTWQVRQTLVAPPDRPGLLMRIAVDAAEPLRIRVPFRPDFRLMWPAEIGKSSITWDAALHAYEFRPEDKPYFGMIGAPGASRADEGYWLEFAPVKGTAERLVIIAGSVKSREEMTGTYEYLASDPERIQREAEDYWERYLAHTVAVEIPDKHLEAAYDWARISMAKGLIEDPLLGEGLVAGFGQSFAAARPGFAWFFGRDSCWSSLAFTAAGDFQTARAALSFIAKYQRADGKMPHEIAQTASLVGWFDKMPYAYASADSTPLFVIAVADYFERTGDRTFLKDMWPAAEKALAFLQSTYDPVGFPKNQDVGHGWVEGGPLRNNVRTEFYQAGVAVAALRAASRLAAATGRTDLSRRLALEFDEKRRLLDKVYWMPASRAYAFATDLRGQPVDEPSVLATVPMWFGVADEGHSREMIERLAGEDFASDWGMRIISSKNPVYDPSGYHFGSVWPLFTGWASVGEYREHMPEQASANLEANAHLTVDGAGDTTEVLSGLSYAPLVTSSSHQIWSSAMVVSPLLRGLFGLEVNASERRIRLEPHLPADWTAFAIRNVPVRTGSVDISFRQNGARFALGITNRTGAPLAFEFAPAFAPITSVQSATKFVREEHGTDWHARFAVVARPGATTIAGVLTNPFGYRVRTTAALPGARSGGLKVLSGRWDGDGLQLRVSAPAGSTHVIDTFGTATESGRVVMVRIPGPPSSEYKTETVRIRLRR